MPRSSPTSNIEDKEFEAAIKEVTSFSQLCADRLMIASSGNNHRSIYTRIRKLGLNTSHWIDRPAVRRVVIEDVLNNRRYLGSYSLKLRLWEAGLKPKQCEICGLTEWCGKPAPLALDHINGNNADNRLENLRILCHNCHAQTDTYTGLNKKSNIAKVKPIHLKLVTPDGFIAAKSTTSVSKLKNAKPTKICWPTMSELAEMVATTPLYKLAISLGVSDRAISKRCKINGISVPDHRKTNR